MPDLLRKSELELEHALNSVALVHEVHKVLAAEPKAPTEFPQEAGSLVLQIDEILEHTPDAHVPLEWRVLVAGIRVLASQVACLTIAKVGKGDLLAERARCDVLINELPCVVIQVPFVAR